MSRAVPIDQPLSERDREYLLARGQSARVEMIDVRTSEEEPQDDSVVPAVTPSKAPLVPEDDYDQWTVEDLREELGDRQLSKDGRKAELIARLRESDLQQ